jgi:hypothetical protein
LRRKIRFSHFLKLQREGIFHEQVWGTLVSLL